MKRFFACAVFAFALVFGTQAQDTSGVKLDLLKAPSSPASNLLGIAPSDIEKPTDVSAFMLSLFSASQSLAKLPANYAIDIAPYWLRNRRHDYTTASLNSRNKGDVFRQTLVLSAAVRNPDSGDVNFDGRNFYSGFGFKFSLVRGDYADDTKASLNRIGDLQKKLNAMTMVDLKEFRRTDPQLKKLLAARDEYIQAQVNGGLTRDAIKNTATYKRFEEEINNANALWEKRESAGAKAYLNELKTEAEKFIINRQGWSWDVAGGISGSFRNKRFDNSRLYNAGIWTTVGYTGGKGSSFLGLLRFLHNPDQQYLITPSVKGLANISTLDGGIRYAYSNLPSRFSASLEAIYRSVLSSNTIAPSWRLVFNAEYAIWANQKLTFSFGRNFDGTVSKDGNLIAALNFLTGFGNRR